ncbi:MAG: PKD domain-containing protein, partial [Patescibacteria group bacterium]
MHYEDDLLSTDKQTVNITLKDAGSVTFNAEDTKAAKYKWNFGNGKTTEYGTTAEGETKYTEAGKYQITLEVINQVGVVDRKMFTLEVSSVAAHLNAKPANGAFINSPVIFDASGSKSDIGKITNYEWTITAIPDPKIPKEIQTEIDGIYPFTDSGASLKVLTHEFKYPLDYDITVTVKDDNGSDEDKIEGYRVESNPPVALFDYTAPLVSEPGTFHFNALPSYDPDGVENFKYDWTITPEEGWGLTDEAKHGLNSDSPIVKFKTKGDYEVKLKVTDNLADDEIGEITKNVKVDNVLDVSWDELQKTTAVLNDSEEAKVDFKFKSDTAVAYEIDFGDGETDNGEVTAGKAEKSHIYREAGKFNVKVTVYDEEDNENTLLRKVIIGGGKKPLAKITLLVNGEEIHDLAKPVKVSKKDKLEFDASDSKN